MSADMSVCPGNPGYIFFTEILFTDVEYLSMKVKIDSCTYHTDRLHTMNPIDHHILASLTSKSILIPSGKGSADRPGPLVLTSRSRASENGAL